MAVRSAEAVWQGTLKEGSGNIKSQSKAIDGAYSFRTRFEEEPGTNPEELIAAAHAGCFSMALSAGLTRAGFKPERVHTTAKVHLEQKDGAPTITRIELDTDASVPGIDNAAFQEQAETAKKNCPVSRVLAAADISLNARLA
jgi:osmotically inducible protein OsmC